MSYLQDPKRTLLIEQALDATTLEEIVVATQTLRQWVKHYPDDLSIRDAFEQLATMREIAEMQVPMPLKHPVVHV